MNESNQAREYPQAIEHDDAPPDQTVLLVLRDMAERELLAFYLGARGWNVRLADFSRAVREWNNGQRAPFIVLKIDDDDPDAFELLGALAARTIDASMVVCVDPALAGDITHEEARLLGVERLLVGLKFAELARTLDEMRGGLMAREEA